MEAQSSTATPPAKVPKISDKVIAQSGEPMEIAAGGTSEIGMYINYCVYR